MHRYVTVKPYSEIAYTSEIAYISSRLDQSFTDINAIIAVNATLLTIPQFSSHLWGVDVTPDIQFWRTFINTFYNTVTLYFFSQNNSSQFYSPFFLSLTLIFPSTLPGKKRQPAPSSILTDTHLRFEYKAPTEFGVTFLSLCVIVSAHYEFIETLTYYYYCYY